MYIPCYDSHATCFFLLAACMVPTQNYCEPPLNQLESRPRTRPCSSWGICSQSCQISRAHLHTRTEH